jgi:hypothetical protein
MVLHPARPFNYVAGPRTTYISIQVCQQADGNPGGANEAEHGAAAKSKQFVVFSVGNNKVILKHIATWQ